MIMPAPSLSAPSSAWDRLFAPPIAHRGLWTPAGPPENSLAAFEAACAAGYGIELDVQLSADGEAIVFHDRHLARMAGAAATLSEKTAAALSALRLKNTGEPIPTLRQVLELVDGRSLILIEIKSAAGEEGPLDKRVADIIEHYQGPLAIIGFNPFSQAWWAQNHAEVLRGLDSYGYDDEAAQALPTERRRAFQALEHVAIARPHFLALGRDMLPGGLADLYRRAGYPIIAWTVRGPEQWSTIADHCDNLIFEGFEP
jgi:glycerophosphoryl diester phosphodiesterase